MRPFIANLAKLYAQNGWIANTAEGISIEIEGKSEFQNQFLDSLTSRLPPLASVVSMTVKKLPLSLFKNFVIKSSSADGAKSAFVLPDIATCPACIDDLFDPKSRFYRYPFTSCSHCGPRYSIMLDQPYDRNRTSMSPFVYCADCEQDYHNSENRRFHAQTIACPNCGPTMSLIDQKGSELAACNQALTLANRFLHQGKILAIKGIGGFQLMADATNQEAIEQLRIRKYRPQKPFALMVANLAAAERLCLISEIQRQALTAYSAPIVLLNKKIITAIADAVAPDLQQLGVMLAYSPLHHLLLHDFGKPLVATSGNRQNEPICIENNQALAQLSDIADYFLVHDRAILRPLDDSIVRVFNDKVSVLRRARGYVPMPIRLENKALPTLLAVGGHLKNTVAVSTGRQIIVSQHLGDLDNETTQRQFESTITDLQHFYQIKPTKIIHDLHSAFTSSQHAEKISQSVTQSIPTQAVQHHYAHVLSCMAEHNLEPPLLGIAWDGSGLGTDHTLWGGEFLRLDSKGFQRFGHFRSFSLPGGYKAILEPRRSALGILYELFPKHMFDLNHLTFSKQEQKLLTIALAKQFNCPHTTSVGRLFDACAALLGVCYVNDYEGQAAIALENCTAYRESDEYYPFQLLGSEPLNVDWQMIVENILQDIKLHSRELIAVKFHNTLSEIILAVALRANESTVVLSGGCFQNAYLVNKSVRKLKLAGFAVYCHEQIPPNDGGLAIGQLYAEKYRG